jgi:DNA-binding winged helix-turn-helix (wHTH) protein
MRVHKDYDQHFAAGQDRGEYRRAAIWKIVWINGVPHVPLAGYYSTRQERTRLRQTMSWWYRSQHNGVLLDPASRILHWRGVSVHLTPHQFGVLACLVAAKGASVSRDQILRQAWGYIPSHRSDDVLRSHIAGLRRALRNANLSDSLIQNVRGGNYMLAVPGGDSAQKARSQ